jgi:molybdopterin converting factor small subunit
VAVTVRFPAMLHTKAGPEVVIDEPVASVADLMTVLDRRIPGLATELSDPIFNIAVNDEMLLHRAHVRTLADGDVVEFVPTIAGG